MRDYNAIPFRAPRKSSTTSSQASSSPSSSTGGALLDSPVVAPYPQFRHHHHQHHQNNTINQAATTPRISNNNNNNNNNNNQKTSMINNNNDNDEMEEEEKKDELTSSSSSPPKIVASSTASMTTSSVASEVPTERQISSSSPPQTLSSPSSQRPNRSSSTSPSRRVSALPPPHFHSRRQSPPIWQQPSPPQQQQQQQQAAPSSSSHSSRQSLLQPPQAARRSSPQQQQRSSPLKPSQLPQPQSQVRTPSTSSPRSLSQPQQQKLQQQQQSLSPTQSVSSPQQQQQQQQLHVSPTSQSSLLSQQPSLPGAENTTTRGTTPATTSTSNSKSADAMILELRSSVRQLKRQLQQVQEERENLAHELEQVRDENNMMNTSTNRSLHSDATDGRVGELQVQLDRAHAQIITADMVRKELEDTLEAEQYTWELRVQDQERTIKQLQQEVADLAEELQDCKTQWKTAEASWKEQLEDMQLNLDKAQQEARHWRTMQAQQDSRDVSELKQRLLDLEQERAELQGCLDEALKELEAVDAELQADTHNNGSGPAQQQLRQENERLQQLLRDNEQETLTALRHLYRWLLERDQSNHTDDPMTKSREPRLVRDVIAAIQSHLEHCLPANSSGAGGDDHDLNDMRKQVQELETQLSVYRGDLQAREESSAELRSSLKEAVALLKPLQDAVAKADGEKAKLQEKIDDLQTRHKNHGVTEEQHRQEVRRLKDDLRVKEEEIERLREEVQTLEVQLSRANVKAASAFLTPPKTSVNESTNESIHPDSLSKAREELRAKRATEKTLKQLLQDAQSRFQTLHSQNKEVEAINHALQDKLKEAETKAAVVALPSSSPSLVDEEELNKVRQKLGERERRIQDLENDLRCVKGEMTERDIEIRNLQFALEDAKKTAVHGGAAGASEDDKVALREAQLRICELETKLAAKTEELVTKKSVERALNRSLKEALGLVKPLQQHLEEAENEKAELAEEIRALKSQLKDMNNGMSKSLSPQEQDGVRGLSPSYPSKDAATIRGLQETVRHLEKENSQLHDALEDMSQSINASHFSTGTGSIASQRNESRLREELVELKSRYEVTQGRLEDAYVENHTLVEALSKREREERSLMDEIKGLREKLHKAEDDLENAKHIATTALVKVEELTMANVERSAKNSDLLDHDAIYRDKARVLDKEMASARVHNPKVPYRLT